MYLVSCVLNPYTSAHGLGKEARYNQHMITGYVPAREAGFSGALSRMFPTPHLLYPPAAGIDISDSSVKWLRLVPDHDHLRVAEYGELPLEKGIVTDGVINDVSALATVLHEIRRKLGSVECAHVALPEEAAFVFDMRVPRGTSREQVLRMVEFELEDRVPIPPADTVYDYNEIENDGKGNTQIGVTVFPNDLAKSYADAFRAAGIMLLSLEIEARSIARAVTSGMDDPVSMLVDFGRARTGIAVVKRGVPIFTSTVSVGGDLITKEAIAAFDNSPEEAQKFKNEVGLLATGDVKKELADSLEKTASALADEVARHFHYWDTRRDEHDERTSPLERVYIVGGNGNLMGLDDYLAGKVQAQTFKGNPWRHVADFDDYIPPITKRESITYATSIGLALRNMML